jgi:hypothetical protein
VRRLLIRPGAIGDFVLSLPAMEWVGKESGAEVWAASRNLPLARFASRTRAIASTGIDLIGLPDVSPPAGLIEELRGFDSIVSWYGANRLEFRQAVEELGLPFQLLAAVPPEGAGVHAADFYFQQVGGGGEASPRLGCPPGDGGFVAIHPFSGSPKKNWPLDRYKELGRRLSLHLPVRWILERGGPPVDGVDVEPPIDDLYELACRLAQARLYIGNDSGITHLAAAAGARVLALFGPTDPAIWAPRGPNVRVISTRKRGESIEQVGLAGVVEAAQGLMG